MDTIAGSADLLGWGSDDTPWFGGNPTDKPVSVLGITIPARQSGHASGARPQRGRRLAESHRRDE